MHGTGTHHKGIEPCRRKDLFLRDFIQRGNPSQERVRQGRQRNLRVGEALSGGIESCPSRSQYLQKGRGSQLPIRCEMNHVHESRQAYTEGKKGCYAQA